MSDDLTPAPRRPSRLGAAFLLLGVFVAGGIAGGAVEASHLFGPKRPMRGPGGFVQYLATELTLTPAQQDSVRAILRRHEGEMDSLWSEMRPRFETLRATVRSEIAAQLDGAQRQKYDDLNRREESRRSDHD